MLISFGSGPQVSWGKGRGNGGRASVGITFRRNWDNWPSKAGTEGGLNVHSPTYSITHDRQLRDDQNRCWCLLNWSIYQVTANSKQQKSCYQKSKSATSSMDKVAKQKILHSSHESITYLAANGPLSKTTSLCPVFLSRKFGQLWTIQRLLTSHNTQLKDEDHQR